MATPEQRAKEAALKEKKRKEKLAKKKKREEEERIKAEADKKLAMLAERRKRDPKIDGPARPVKPPYNEESSRMIDAIRSGQLKERYFYDDGLRGLLIIQNQLEAARRDRRARQPLGEDSGSDAAGGRGVAMPAVKKAPPTLKAVRKKKG